MKLLYLLLLTFFCLNVNAEKKKTTKESGLEDLKIEKIEKIEKPDKNQKTEETEKKQKEVDAVEEFNRQNPQNQNQANIQPAAGSFWGPFLFLLIVGATLYFGLRYIRRKKKPTISDADFMQSLGSLALAGGTYLEIVELGSKIFLLGVGSSAVNLIMEITDQELILKLKSRPLAPKHKSFIEVLSGLVDKKGTAPIKIDAQKKLMGFLKHQKDRIKKII